MNKLLKFLGVWMLVLAYLALGMVFIFLAQEYTGAWYLGIGIPLFAYVCWAIWIAIDD